MVTLDELGVGAYHIDNKHGLSLDYSIHPAVGQ